MPEGSFHAPGPRVKWFSDVIVETLASPAAPLRVLDIGCGAGEQIFDLATRLPAASFVGVDISSMSIASAEKRRAASAHRDRLTFRREDFRTFAVDRPFDLVISFSVLQTIPGENEALLLQIARQLAPGGLFVNAMPYRCAYNRTLAGMRGGLRLVQSPTTDRVLMVLARMVHGSSMDSELLGERIPYAYLTPVRYDDDLANMERRIGLRTTAVRDVPHASPAQLKHRLRVMQRDDARRA